jgi:hypothetical protein
MSTRLLGIHVVEDFHMAAHMTAKRKGLTLKDWLLPIIRENLDPEIVSIFLDSNAQLNEQECLVKNELPPAA